MSKTKTWTCDKEQSTGHFPANYGNGNDDHSPIGLYTIALYRDFLHFAEDWSGVYQIQKAVLRLTTTTEVHVAFGGTPRIVIDRLTGSFSQGGGSEGSWTTTTTVHPGPSATGSGEADSGTITTGHQRTVDITITALIEAIAPSSVLDHTGSPCPNLTNYGLRIESYDEASTGRTTEFYSRRSSSGYRPQVILTYSDNRPPAQPVVTDIAGAVSGTSDPVIVGSPAADELDLISSFVDPDGDDFSGDAQVQVFADGATDATPGVALVDIHASTSQGSDNSVTAYTPGVPKRQTLRSRLRLQDARGAWSAWSSLSDPLARFRTAYSIGAPTNAFMQTDPTAPHIYGSLNSGDPADYISSWEGEFYQDTSGGAVTLWAPGVTGIGGTPTRSDITYGGTALNPGDVVRWRQRHYNQDGVPGAWSSYVNTTMATSTGPTTMTPSDVSTKLTTRTPTLTIGNAVNFDRYQYRIYRGGAIIYDSGVVTVGTTASVSPVVPAGYLTWGDTLTWDAVIRPTGNTVLDPFSPQRGMQVDSLPTTALSITA